MPSGFTLKPLVNIITAMQELYQAPPSTIRGIEDNEWFGPLQPVKPIAPVGTEPRASQYPAGRNLIFTPRAEEEWTAADLRKFARYDLARIIIENTKDQLCSTPWQFRVKPLPGESDKQRASREQGDEILIKLSRFFECPDGEHTWSEWLRPLLDDMLVIDAPSILLRKSKADELVELRVIDGASITRYIDVNGFTPQPPSPAYAQIWYGSPMVDLTTDQLVYKPRNILSYKLYGYGPVEQALNLIMIGMNRLIYQKNYYSEGSIPDAIQIVPKGVSPDQIETAQEWLTSDLAGNLAKRRQIRLLQGFTEDGKDQLLFPKEALLADPFDDLVLRCLCFTFGASPQRLLKQMNRASAQQADESAEEEGEAPFRGWIQDTVNFIVQRKMGLVDYEFGFNLDRELDALKQAQADEIDLRNSVRTINEVREDRGLDARPEPEANQLGVTRAIEMQANNDGSNGQPTRGNASEGDGGEPTNATSKRRIKGRLLRNAAVNIGAIATAGAISEQTGPAIGFASGAAGPDKKKIKAAKITAELTVESQSAMHAMKGRLSTFLRQQGHALSEKARAAFNAKKADDPSDEQKRRVEDALFAKYGWDWSEIVDDVARELITAAESGSALGETQLAIDDEDIIGGISKLARGFAEDRAAEMVGMKWVDGKLVANPNADFTITEATRAKLRELIATAFEGPITADELAQQIQDAGMFSEARGALIAKTEIGRSQRFGNLAAWQESGVVETGKWLTSGDHKCCDECDLYEAEGAVDLDTIEGWIADVHPGCYCTVVVAEVSV